MSMDSNEFAYELLRTVATPAMATDEFVQYKMHMLAANKHTRQPMLVKFLVMLWIRVSVRRTPDLPERR